MTTEVLAHPTTASASRDVTAAPTECGFVPVDAGRSFIKPFQWLGRRRAAMRRVVYVSWFVDVGGVELHHAHEVEPPIDYSAAAAVLARARRVEETEEPIGGTPFGA